MEGVGTILEVGAHYGPLCAAWELKAAVYFLQTPYFFIKLQWAEKAKILASNNGRIAGGWGGENKEPIFLTNTILFKKIRSPQ